MVASHGVGVCGPRASAVPCMQQRLVPVPESACLVCVLCILGARYVRASALQMWICVPADAYGVYCGCNGPKATRVVRVLWLVTSAQNK